MCTCANFVWCLQAGFTHFKPSVGYNSGPVVGNVLFGFTYLLDLVLVADIIVSTKKAVQTPTGQSITPVSQRTLAIAMEMYLIVVTMQASLGF